MNDSDRRAALLRQAVNRSGPVVPTHEDWPLWMWLARMDRVAPLLFQLVEHAPGELSDDQRTEARQLFGAVMCRCVQLEHHLIVVVGLLSANGIRSIVLKGGATAHLDYPDPSWREFSDIDLLIDPSDRVRATQVVEAAGWVQGYALPSGHDDFAHAVTFVKDGMELDLHQHIAHRALGRLVPTVELISRGMPLPVAGVDLVALDDVDRFIHSTVHAVASGRENQRLSNLADVLVMAEDRPTIAEAVLVRAEQRRVRSLVERGVADAYTTAQLDVNVEWLEAMRRPVQRRDRLVDRAYLDNRRRPVFEELAHLRQLGSGRDGARYIAGYFVNDQDGLRARAGYMWSKFRGTSG